MAGIPVDSSSIDTELWAVLHSRPAEFAAAAVAALQHLERGESARQEAAAQEAAAAAANSPDSRGHEGSGTPSPEASQAASGVVYLWALAEAYLQHPLVQESMRLVLGRQGSSPLAAGPGDRRPAAEVQLLLGQEGRYSVGAVRFVNGTADASSGFLSDSGGVQGYGKVVMPPVALGAHAEEPRPISRAAAARAYSMYQCWGYFNRHMTLRREVEAAVLGPGPRPKSDGRAWLSAGQPGSSRADTPYGEITKVWRFFENVPEELSQIRTAETAAAADLHVRTLFGEEQECITTMSAWKHMCDEAQWVGRALYDAEQLVLINAPRCTTYTWHS